MTPGANEFWVPIDPDELKRQRAKARALRDIRRYEAFLAVGR